MSVRALGRDPNASPPQPSDWGRPGHLAPEEVKAFGEFQMEVIKRGGEFRETVYCFGEEEGESNTLCRWLRARKFHLADTIKMVEEATVARKEPREHNFFPDGRAALGCSPSLYLAQYPQLYSGFAKNGCPVFISKPGVIDIDAIECITSVEGILNYHWHIMCHDYADRLRKAKAANSDFSKFECLCVLDLEHLTSSQLNSRTLHIIKVQAFVDSLCFPETMHKMLLVNAPSFFSLSWSLIKGWLDARTASKIEVISSRKSWEARLLELVDSDQLPSDYGGKGPSTTEVFKREAAKGDDMKRRVSHLLHVRNSGSHLITLEKGEIAEVMIHTRSLSGAKFEILDSTKATLAAANVAHKGTGADTEMPSNITLAKSLKGPGTLKIKAVSNSGMFSSDKFLIECIIRDDK